MDSSFSQTSNSTSTRFQMKANNAPIITPSKNDIFLSTYRRQNFSLPNSIMHYIAKNPKNSDIYQTMIESCKYFFIKNTILIFHKLSFSRNEWQFCHDDKPWRNFDIKNYSGKLWITGDLHIESMNGSNQIVASLTIPNIYQFEETFCLSLDNQIISLNDLLFLSSSADILTLKEITVKYDDGTVVAFEKLIEKLAKVKSVYYTFTTPSNNISKTTFKKLWKIPHLSNCNRLSLYNIPEEFDVDSFYSFMKKNKKTRIVLSFSNQISEEYKIRLEAIVDEIIGTKNHGYKPPYIYFSGINPEQFRKLRYIYFCRCVEEFTSVLQVLKRDCSRFAINNF